MNDRGSEEEKKARLFLASLEIDCDRLTPEECVTQLNMRKKSTQLKSFNNQRGKGGLYQTHGKWKQETEGIRFYDVFQIEDAPVFAYCRIWGVLFWLCL